MPADVKELLTGELERASRDLARSMMLGVDGAAHPGAPASDEERMAMQDLVGRLGRLVAGLPALGDATLPDDRAGYGSQVEVEDLRTGRRETYTLVTGELLDLEENHVTLGSPLGQALLGRRAGERVEADLPQGPRKLRITALVTLPRLLRGPGRRSRR